jgi:Fe-S cluster assembly protein SufD
MSVALPIADILRTQGVPHRRLEDWKYTDLRKVVDEDTIATAGAVTMTVSIPEGVKQVQPITDGELAKRKRALAREQPSSPGVMAEAAADFAEGGLILCVPDGTHIADPLRVDIRGDGHGKIVLVLGSESSLRFVEKHHSGGNRLRNVLVNVHLEDGATLTHFREAAYSGQLPSVETLVVYQGRNSRYCAHYCQQGARLSRLEADLILDGEGAEANLSGLSVLGDEAHADITTRIEHAAPNTTSRQLFKKVAGGKSRAVYQGKITVKEGAIGSDSRQTAKALLLSNRAETDLKPELEILTDDVKCAHGAAVGDLDQDSLFYLRSRGIPEREARGLLVHAFLGEVIDGIANEEMRKSALAFVDDGLALAMGTDP